MLEESSLDEDPSEIDQPLVIDEPSAVPVANVAPTPEPVKVATSVKKGVKRKAENSPATPVAAKKAAKVPSRTSSPVPSTPTAASTPAETEKTSRSGRVIKPKKFEDNENGEATPAKNVRYD